MFLYFPFQVSHRFQLENITHKMNKWLSQEENTHEENELYMKTMLNEIVSQTYEQQRNKCTLNGILINGALIERVYLQTWNVTIYAACPRNPPALK